MFWVFRGHKFTTRSSQRSRAVLGKCSKTHPKNVQFKLSNQRLSQRHVIQQTPLKVRENTLLNLGWNVFCSCFRPTCMNFLSLYILNQNRADFNWVTKAIRNCFGFVSLRSTIGLKNPRHFLNQSDAKPKTNTTWSHAFPRALRRWRVSASCSYWFIVLFTFAVIGYCVCFGFGFTTLNW